MLYPSVLDENLLSGTLSSALISLPNIQVFSVSRRIKSGRKLQGPLPSFSNFRELLMLNLAGNELSGTLPADFLSDSIWIQTVDLRDNNLLGSIPSTLQSLKGLNLVLTGNMITSVPKAFCDNLDWMDGLVGSLGSCDAILCPPHTSSPLGRTIDDMARCEACSTDSLKGSPFYGSTTCAGPVDERDLLVNLFLETEGVNWRRNDFWLTNTDICTWYGVGCVDDHVVLLNLRDNNLHGAMPPGIFDMPHLQILWLGANPLRVSLENINRATKLLDFRIDAVELVSLEGISAATSLTVLDARSNFLQQGFPEEVLELFNLRMLDLSDNRLFGPLPDLFDKLRYLRTLRLRNNKLDGPVPSFDGLNMLSELDLSNNRLTGTLPLNFLASLPSATTSLSLDLSHNMLVGAIPSEIGRFPNLILELGGNRFDHIPDDLCNSSSGWNRGAVGRYGCDGILCSPGTWNQRGRQVDDATLCLSCPQNSSVDDTTNIHGTMDPSSISLFFGQIQCDGMTTRVDRSGFRQPLFSLTTSIGLFLLIAIR